MSEMIRTPLLHPGALLRATHRLPTRLVPHRRSLSLWGGSPPHPGNNAPLADPFDTPRSDLSIPSNLIHNPTFFEPLSTALLALPPSLSLSYALFLPFFTLVLRTSTTLPLTLWQRARTRKFGDVVMPLIRKAQAIARIEVRDECRRAGKSYEEYNKAYKARARKDAGILASSHGATPMLTLLLPPLLHIPIFISTTLILRDACQRSLASLPLLPTDPTAPYASLALAHLHDLAATPFLWCPSMILPDPTMGLPLAVGLAALANVELSAKTRRATAAAAMAVAQSRAKEEERKKPVMRKAGTLTNAEKRRQNGVKKVENEGEQEEEPRTARIITNALRVSAVLFIPIAAMAPAAVCGYWLTSNLFTLSQNAAFGWIDRRREEERQLAEVVKGRP